MAVLGHPQPDRVVGRQGALSRSVLSVWLTWIGLLLTAGLVWRLSSSDVLSWRLVGEVGLEVELQVVVVVLVGEDPALLRGARSALR